MKSGFHRWVFDQLDVPSRARLLEVGCGPGHLWAANRERMPAGWEAFLSGFSYGMITAARSRLGAGFRLEVADAEALPHPSGTFHAAIANHMLYHVQNRPRAIRDLARVLRPDGTLYAVTNGRDHLRELDELVARWLPPCAARERGAAFGLENGAAARRRLGRRRGSSLAGCAGGHRRRGDRGLRTLPASWLRGRR